MIEAVIAIVAVCVIAGIVNLFGVGDRKKPLFETISLRESMDLCNLPVVTFTNNGKKFNFVLDSGASESHVSPSAIAQMLTEDSDTESSLQVQGVTGGTMSCTSKLAVLEYKSNTYNIEVYVTESLDDSFAEIKKNLGVQLHGIIGNGFLREYGYVLDFDKLIAYSVIS